MNAFYGNMSWFEEFAYNGGILEVHAATNSVWVDSLLPGGIMYTHGWGYSGQINYENQYHPILFAPNDHPNVDSWGSSLYSGYLHRFPQGTAVIVESGYCEAILVELGYGAGTIIVTTMPLDWAYGIGYSTLLENVMAYVTPLFTHDCSVSLEAPIYIPPGDTTRLNVTVHNVGLVLETSLLIQLLIDGVEVDSWIIRLDTPAMVSTECYCICDTSCG
jgi:hypothetical protein